MKKIILIYIVLLLNENAFGQTLDVAGTLNVEGNLKFAGTQGVAGEILMINSQGKPVWNTLTGQFKKSKIIISPLSPSTSTFTINIPAGSLIVVEMYGAGGGGAFGGGGGSGAYNRYTFVGNANGTNTFTYLLGRGGAAATSSSNSGDNGDASTLTFNSITYSTSGGDAASSLGTGNAMGFAIPTLSASLIGHFALPGKPATKTEITYAQKNATTFVKIIKSGNGGNSPNLDIEGAKGAYEVLNESNGSNLDKTLSQNGILNVGGGGGPFNTLNTIYGGVGGNAFLVFYWND